MIELRVSNSPYIGDFEPVFGLWLVLDSNHLPIKPITKFICYLNVNVHDILNIMQLSTRPSLWSLNNNWALNNCVS